MNLRQQLNSCVWLNQERLALCCVHLSLLYNSWLHVLQHVFDSFRWRVISQNSEAVFLTCFFQFRFVVKYRHCDGKLVLKGTDDQVVII